MGAEPRPRRAEGASLPAVAEATSPTAAAASAAADAGGCRNGCCRSFIERGLEANPMRPNRPMGKSRPRRHLKSKLKKLASDENTGAALAEALSKTAISDDDLDKLKADFPAHATRSQKRPPFPALVAS